MYNRSCTMYNYYYAYVEVCACVCVYVYVYVEKKDAVACAVKLKIDCPLESQLFDERWCDKHKYREFCLVLFIKSLCTCRSKDMTSGVKELNHDRTEDLGMNLAQR